MNPDIATRGFLCEYLSIRHGTHPKWKGDPTLNAEAYTRQWGRLHPKDAPSVADKIQTLAALGEFLPPGAAERVANDLRYAANSPNNKE